MFVSSLIFCCYSSFRMPIDACVHVCRGASQTTDYEWGTKWNAKPQTQRRQWGASLEKNKQHCAHECSAHRESAAKRAKWRERETALRCINKRNALFISVVSPYSLGSVCCCCLSLCQRRCQRLSGCIFVAAPLRLQVVMTTTRRRQQQQQQNRKAKAASGRQKKELADEQRLSNTVYSGA